MAPPDFNRVAVVAFFWVAACGSTRLVDRHGNPAPELPFPAVVGEFDGVVIRASDAPGGIMDPPLQEVLVDAPAALETVSNEVGGDLIRRVEDLVHTRASLNNAEAGRALFARSGESDHFTMWIQDVGNLRLVAHEFAHILVSEEWNGLQIRSLPHLPNQFEGPNVHWSAPASLSPTRYSRQDIHEWFAEVYGSLFALANQLSGPLLQHSQMLDGPAFADIADSLCALGLLQSGSAAFVRRFFENEWLRTDVAALHQLVLDSNYADFVWQYGSRSTLISRSWWRKNNTLIGGGPVRLAALNDRQFQEAQGSARRVLFEVLAMTNLEPVQLISAANRLAATGQATEARSLVDEAFRHAARRLKHPFDLKARATCRAFTDSLPLVAKGVRRYMFQLQANQLDTNCLAGAAAILSDVDEELLGCDPMARIRWLLACIRPTDGFLRYVEIEDQERR